jgi:CheY-like chemotaxis protein
VLCNGHELWQTYELCKNERFDDYVLFWPITNDAPRLRMAVHQAMRRLKERALAPVTAGELASQVRALASLEQDLMESIAQIGRNLEHVGTTVKQAEQAMSSLGAETASAEPARVQTEGFAETMRTISTAVAGLQQRASEVERYLATQLQPVRKVLQLSEQIRSTILVVEDDEFQQKLIGKLLAGQNVVVQFASTASEAMALMWQRRPNVVLMDVGLPDISGVELTRRIRRIANFSEVQIVMITGHSERQVVVQSLQAGATDFLVKPLDRARLLDKLRNFLPQNPAA